MSAWSLISRIPPRARGGICGLLSLTLMLGCNMMLF